MSLTFNSGVKWSENAAEYREKELRKSREVLRGKISTALETIRFDLYVAAVIEFTNATHVVRTPFTLQRKRILSSLIFLV